MAAQKERKFYIKGSVLPFEEDNRNEFKGHLNLCKEEIPTWAQARKTEKASRRPASRNFNAFLNSGIGGTIFLGVVDNGQIMGFRMSRLQRDHFLKAVEDLVGRYTPKVLPQQYSVGFVPVFNNSLSQQDIASRLNQIAREEVPEMHRGRKHTLRHTDYCWCDKDFMATHNLSNQEGQEFVVELTVKPWDRSDLELPSVGQGSEVARIRFQPYYSDEEGKVYFRRQASVVQYSVHSIAQITKQEVKEQYLLQIKKLQQEIQHLEKEKAAQQQTVP